MRALLQAIEEGRLIELPENDKEKALTLLATMIEAVPSVPPGLRLVEAVLAREAQANTCLVQGWAVPHARVPQDGDLICCVGWSPVGIPYGTADGVPVRVVLLYYVPDSQRGAYLREISALARVLQAETVAQRVFEASTLDGLRIRLLDVVTAALGTSQAEARARMVRLEARATAAGVAPPQTFDPTQVVPAWIVDAADGRVMVLARDEGLVRALEAQPDLGLRLARQAVVSVGGHTIHVRQSSTYGLGRSLFDCLIVKAK
ncbi:MAG TPA: PTS sugar transporter subunit IIA [Planctomycetota bacterium]|nr:PTS sugar transporter subunit IIA [Planctomycetota bacterium]HRR83197.1 PTS sugar transporter subunit IIA [Planctomycetota bacterium]HRT94950.1 PTS sugar transporter subunit IIA [Planctomycetota bacterium]